MLDDVAAFGTVQFVYEGISFLNEEQESLLRQRVGGDAISNAVDR